MGDSLAEKIELKDDNKTEIIFKIDLEKELSEYEKLDQKCDLIIKKIKARKKKVIEKEKRD